MIISRAPVRISLGGGGTDLASYYSQFGGFLVAAAINKYVYIAANKTFDDNICLKYSKTEIVRNTESIKHRIFKAAFQMTGIKYGIEMASIADIPANCGLGSSSAFTVALLNALHAYKKEYVSLEQLAEEACKIEIEILGEPIGKQDQYIATFGGLTCLTFDKNGRVTVEPLKIPPAAIHDLENKIMLFYTRIERSASDILADQNEAVQKGKSKTVDNLHKIKEIGLETKKAFEDGNLDRFGELLNLHWETKKKLSDKITDPFIDRAYQAALRKGALGGKLIGAGGGGFLLFYCPKDRASLIEEMKKLGLAWTPFHFEPEGAKIIANLPN